MSFTPVPRIARPWKKCRRWNTGCPFHTRTTFRTNSRNAAFCRVNFQSSHVRSLSWQ